MTNNEFGVLLQGRVSSWTNDIINEYKKNFPNAEIVLSTWKNENVDGINCKVIQSEKPSPTYPHSSARRGRPLYPVAGALGPRAAPS